MTSILAWRIPWTEGLGTLNEVAKSWTPLTHTLSYKIIYKCTTFLQVRKKKTFLYSKPMTFTNIS